MNIQKKFDYEKKMTLNGIDTLSGYIPKKVEKVSNDVKCNLNQCNIKPNIEKTYLLINPNKRADGEKLITKYSIFEQINL